MADGRKRSFISGVLAGCILLAVGGFLIVEAFGFRFGPPGYPHFTEASAKQATLDWARLSPFPAEARSFVITTEGGMFTRAFRVSFFGDPAALDRWVMSCPGITAPNTTKSEAPDGTIIYKIEAGGGAAYAEMVHHPARGTVEIYTYWS